MWENTTDYKSPESPLKTCSEIKGNPEKVAKESLPKIRCAIQDTPLQLQPESSVTDPANAPKISAYLKNTGAALTEGPSGATLQTTPGTQIWIDGKNMGEKFQLPEWSKLSPGLRNRDTGELNDMVLTLKDGEEMYIKIQKIPTTAPTTPDTATTIPDTATTIPDKKESGDRFTAAETDTFLTNYAGAPGDFMNSKAYKPQFDALVRNWDTVSDASVAKFKSLVVKYAESAGVTMPSNFWLTPTTKDWHPALSTTIADKKIFIYNAGAK